MERRSDLDQFGTAVVYQFRSYLRTWRFLGLIVFVALVSLAILAAHLYRGAGYVTTRFPTDASFLESYLGMLGLAVAVTGGFLGGDALAVDLSGGPGYLMLTQPVRRATLLAGRFVAAALAGFAIALVYYAVAASATFAFYHAVPATILLSLGAAFLYGLAVLAVAFFFSSFFKTPAVAIISSVLILIIAFPTLSAIGALTGGEPWYSLDYGSGIISNVFANPLVHETINQVGGRQGVTVTIYTWSPYLWEGVAILFVYLAAFLFASYLVYRYREVKG